MNEIERGGDEERTEDVRILEGALGAVVEREDFRAGEGVEIAEDAKQRGDDGGKHPGIEDQHEALGIVLDDRGIKDRCQRQKGRDGDIHRPARHVLHLRQRQHAADIEGDQQGEQDAAVAGDAQAEDEPDAGKAGHPQLIGRRLVDDEAGEKHAEGNQRRADDAQRHALRVGDARICRLNRAQ